MQVSSCRAHAYRSKESCQGYPFVFIGDATIQRVFYACVNLLRPYQLHGDGSTFEAERYVAKSDKASSSDITLSYFFADSPKDISKTIADRCDE